MEVTEKDDTVIPATVDLHYEILMSCNKYIKTTPEVYTKKNLPEWYNEKLFKRGQTYMITNRFSLTVSNVLGLLVVFYIPEIVNILNFTKQSSCPMAAFKRYLETIIHIRTLHTEDIDDPNSKFWKSLNTIRWKHSVSSKRASDGGVGKIMQKQMALTQFGFIGYTFLNPKELGFTNTPEDREAYNHFWRVIGYLIGITNEVNICRENVEETTALCKKILQDFTKWMSQSSKDCENICKNAIDGLWYVDVGVDYDATMRFWYELHGLKYGKPLGYLSLLNYYNKKAVYYFMNLPYIQHLVRFYYNTLVRFSVWMGEHYPFIAMLRFGKENSKVNVYPISFK